MKPYYLMNETINHKQRNVEKAYSQTVDFLIRSIDIPIAKKFNLTRESIQRNPS